MKPNTKFSPIEVFADKTQQQNKHTRDTEKEELNTHGTERELEKRNGRDEKKKSQNVTCKRSLR